MAQDQDKDQDDLSAALRGMSTMLTGPGNLEETLTHVAEFAVQAIPGADGAGLTLLAEGQRRQTIVASAEFVRQVDDIQYGIEEGPCITAVDQRVTVTSGSLGGDAQWPHFGPRVGRLGVHSVLSLPLLVPGRVVGAMNVYAHDKDAFSTEAVRLGELFARPAAVSVVNAQLIADSQRLIGQLSEALSSRATIDQALGLMMALYGDTAEEAFARLTAISRRSGRKLRVVAQELLDDGVRRARARPRPTPPTATPPGAATTQAPPQAPPPSGEAPSAARRPEPPE